MAAAPSKRQPGSCARGRRGPIFLPRPPPPFGKCIAHCTYGYRVLGLGLLRLSIWPSVLCTRCDHCRTRVRTPSVTLS
eukprot:6522574-Prymnesium_polylepis.1